MDSAACSSNYVDLTLLDSEGSEDENHNNAFINKLMKLEDYNFACPNLKPVHCGICFDLVQPFSGVVLRECLHEFCKNCLKLAIVTSVEVPVKCPYRGGKDQFQYDCTLFLQDREVRDLCSTEEYDNHLRKSLEKGLGSIQSIYHCKTEDCPGFCEYDYIDIKTFICYLCKIENCMLCNAIHVNQSCDQYKQNPQSTSKSTFQPGKSQPALPTELPVQKNNEPSFMIEETAPATHHFIQAAHKISKELNNAIQKEHTILAKDLPPGIFVRSFEDRVDLLCAMIEGPKNTPYENGLFFFDIKLPPNYPKTAPKFHFISYSPTVIKNFTTPYDRLNPNLYQEGKVCVSLLGTWKGTGNENWNPNCTLLQVLVSIQGLILVDEPFFNEPGLEDQKNTEVGRVTSRLYNEMVLLRVVTSMINLIKNPPAIFLKQILIHVQNNGNMLSCSMINLLDSNNNNNTPGSSTCVGTTPKPLSYALLPLSPNFCIAMTDLIEIFSVQMLEFITAKVD